MVHIPERDDSGSVKATRFRNGDLCENETVRLKSGLLISVGLYWDSLRKRAGLEAGDARFSRLFARRRML